MGQTANPLFIRQKILRSWPNLWYSGANYPLLLHQDLFIKFYIKHQLRLLNLELLDISIKRSIKSTFIHLTVFNWNKAQARKFKGLQPPVKWWFPLMAFRTISGRISTALFRLAGVNNVRFKIRAIRDQKTAVEYLLRLAHPTLLANYLMRRQYRMFSAKRSLKILRSVGRKLPIVNTLLRGLKIRVAGPLKAPRNRRSQILRHLVFGTVPLQCFTTNVLYAVASRSLSEGLVTTKIWLRRELVSTELLVIPLLRASVHGLTQNRKHVFQPRYEYLTKVLKRRKYKILSEVKKHFQPFIYWVILQDDQHQYKNIYRMFKTAIPFRLRSAYKQNPTPWFRAAARYIKGQEPSVKSPDVNKPRYGRAFDRDFNKSKMSTDKKHFDSVKSQDVKKPYFNRGSNKPEMSPGKKHFDSVKSQDVKKPYFNRGSNKSQYPQSSYNKKQHGIYCNMAKAIHGPISYLNNWLCDLPLRGK